jgi:hypothetical protein
MPKIRSISLVFVLALAPLVACGSQATGSGSTSSALGAGDDAGISAADFAACLTTFVECLRADGGDGSDAGSCRDALHACLPKPPPRDGHGGHGGHGGPCAGDGPKGPPPDGDAGPPPAPTDETGAPLPPPDRDHDRPPPPDGDGGPPPPPPDSDGGAHDDATGPGACMMALETCAAGTDAVSTCVDAAVACFAALPKPPAPPPAPSGTST